MFYELNSLGLKTAWACLNGPAKFTINIADGNIQLKHYTSDCRPQNINPSKLINTAALSKRTSGTKNSLRLVFVANRARQDDYLVLATTQLGLQPQEIIQLYA